MSKRTGVTDSGVKFKHVVAGNIDSFHDEYVVFYIGERECVIQNLMQPGSTISDESINKMCKDIKDRDQQTEETQH